MQLRIYAEPSILDGSRPSWVTAVFTNNGVPIIGAEVYFSLEGEGSLGRDTDVTDAYGEAHCWFYPGEVGKSEITAFIWWYE